MSLILKTICEVLRIAIYIRKSRRDRASDEPRLKKQRAELPEHAKNMGATSYTIYDDGHCSASKKNLSNLTERNRMIRDIEAGKIDVILVLEFSRLSRDDSMTDMTNLIALCEEHNVRLATPERLLDPKNIGDWQMLINEGSRSVVEMKTTLGRLAQGLSYAFTEGKFLGGKTPKPYVYDRVTRKVIVDQEALKECQRLWQLAETHSAKAIAKKLSMAYSTVRRALSDKRLDYLQAIRRNPDTGEIIQCEWEPVMSVEQAARISAARRTRASNGASTKPNSLLSGLDMLKCGYCSRTVKTWCNGKPRKDGTKLKYYGCNANNSATTCPESRSIPQIVLDEKVLTNVFNTIGCLEDLMHHWVASQEDDDYDKKMKSLESEKRDIQNKKQRLVDAVAEGTLKNEDVVKLMTRLDANLDEINSKQISLTARNTSPPDWDSLLLTREEFDCLDFIDRRRFLSLILDEIKVYKMSATLIYKFPRASNGDRGARIHLPAQQRGTSKGHSPIYKITEPNTKKPARNGHS